VGVGELAPVILIHTSIAAAIYGVGVAAALVLLPKRSLGWWMAVLSCALVVGLLALAGTNLLYPAGMAVAAILVGVIVRRRRRGRNAEGAVDELARDSV
jgi:amino acid efflux transporter